MVLQLDVTNTLNDQLLENASVELELPEGWQVVRIYPNCKEEIKIGVNFLIRRSSIIYFVSMSIWLLRLLNFPKTYLIFMKIAT